MAAASDAAVTPLSRSRSASGAPPFCQLLYAILRRRTRTREHLRPAFFVSRRSCLELKCGERVNRTEVGAGSWRCLISKSKTNS